MRADDKPYVSFWLSGAVVVAHTPDYCLLVHAMHAEPYQTVPKISLYLYTVFSIYAMLATCH